MPPCLFLLFCLLLLLLCFLLLLCLLHLSFLLYLPFLTTSLTARRRSLGYSATSPITFPRHTFLSSHGRPPLLRQHRLHRRKVHRRALNADQEHARGYWRCRPPSPASQRQG